MFHILLLKEKCPAEFQIAEIITERIVHDFGYAPIVLNCSEYCLNPFEQWNFHVSCSKKPLNKCVYLARNVRDYVWLRFLYKDLNVILHVYLEEQADFDNYCDISNENFHVYSRRNNFNVYSQRNKNLFQSSSVAVTKSSGNSSSTLAADSAIDFSDAASSESESEPSK